MIHDVKFDIRDDPILQNSCQEPSMSSKYDCVLGALLIMLWSWKSTYKSIMTHDVYSWCQFWHQRWSNPPKLQSGIINVLQVWLCPWCIRIMLWNWKSVYCSIMTYVNYSWCQIQYQWLPNPSKLLSGTIKVLPVWLCSW